MTVHMLDDSGFIASIFGSLIGTPTVIAAYHQALKERQEAQRVREGTLQTNTYQEFIAGGGSRINVVSLQALYSLSNEGDVILLPARM